MNQIDLNNSKLMELQLTPTLHDAIITLAAKRVMLMNDIDTLETLVLGSSHGDFGFDPYYIQNSFNLCCRSQDLKHSFYLYQKISKSHKNTKNIVIYYSVFSSGNSMEKSISEKEICPALNELFDLNLYYSDKHIMQLQKNISNKLHDIKVEIDGRHGFLPTHGKLFFPETYGALNRANDHLKLNRISTSNIYLLLMLAFAKNNNHNVFIVIPPTRSDYKESLRLRSQDLFAPLYELLANFKFKNIVINAFDSSLFLDSDFGDYDHLQPLGRGTKILSKLIHEKIKSNAILN